MFELFVARRYLSAKRKQVVISVITAISVVGVASGVMALVIALAVNNGFRNSLERNLLGATAHVSILEKEPGPGIEDWEQLAPKLAKLPHVRTAEPALYDNAFVHGPVDSAFAVVKGVSPEAAPVTNEFLAKLKAGSMHDLVPKGDQDPGIVIGAKMAEKIGAVVGKPV